VTTIPRLCLSLALVACSSGAKKRHLTPEQMVTADPLPLAKGAKWTYTVTTKKFDPDTNKETTKTLEWTTEVTGVKEANGVTCDQFGPDRSFDWCPSRVGTLLDDARSANTISLVGFIVGGVGVAGGVTLLLTTSKSAPAQTAHVAPYLGLGAAGVRGREAQIRF